MWMCVRALTAIVFWANVNLMAIKYSTSAHSKCDACASAIRTAFTIVIIPYAMAVFGLAYSQ